MLKENLIFFSKISWKSSFILYKKHNISYIREDINNKLITKKNFLFFKNINISQQFLYKNYCSCSSHTPDEIRAKSKDLINKAREREKYERKLNLIYNFSGFKKAIGFQEKVKYLYNMAKELSKHMWEGSKGLFRNTMETRRLIKLKRNGTRLTRHQERFIRQNIQDLKNLIPFFLVWRIPIFGDFILPIFIAKYPELLPSTFNLVKKPTMEEKIIIGKLKQRSLLTRDIQYPHIVDHSQFLPKLDKLLEVINYIKKTINGVTGSITSYNVILNREMLRRYCYFDILTWRQVAALCSRLGLGTRAPKSWLIKRIRKHILHIMKDDQLIYEEGIDSLNEEELQEACWERGLKVLELDVSTLRIQLDEWLKLSLRWETLIEPLLIYAHAFEEKELFFQPGNDKMDSHL